MVGGWGLPKQQGQGAIDRAKVTVSTIQSQQAIWEAVEAVYGLLGQYFGAPASQAACSDMLMPVRAGQHALFLLVSRS